MYKKIFFSCVFAIALLFACKKDYNVTPTYAKVGVAITWAKTEQYYSPKPEIYLDSIGTWRKFTSFAFTSDAEPDKIGFQNPYVAGKGTNALYMNSIYSNAIYTKLGTNISQDSGTYNTIIPKCFQFIPKSKDTVTQGTVVVLPQDVTLTRRDKTQFVIKIMPSDQPGTYNTETGVFEIEVVFDESSIGGNSAVKRRYRFKS